MLIEKQLGEPDSYLIRKQCQDSVTESSEKLSVWWILFILHYDFQTSLSQILKVTWLRRILQRLARASIRCLKNIPVLSIGCKMFLSPEWTDCTPCLRDGWARRRNPQGAGTRALHREAVPAQQAKRLPGPLGAKRIWSSGNRGQALRGAMGNANPAFFSAV